MLGKFRKRSRRLSALLVLVFSALWFVNAAAQCVATTAPACDAPDAQCANLQSDDAGATFTADETAVPCALPVPNTLVSAAQGFTFTPILVSAAFAATIVPVIDRPPPYWHDVRPPHTPTYLQHLALLF